MVWRPVSVEVRPRRVLALFVCGSSALSQKRVFCLLHIRHSSRTLIFQRAPSQSFLVVHRRSRPVASRRILSGALVYQRIQTRDNLNLCVARVMVSGACASCISLGHTLVKSGLTMTPHRGSHDRPAVRVLSMFIAGRPSLYGVHFRATRVYCSFIFPSSSSASHSLDFRSTRLVCSTAGG